MHLPRRTEVLTLLRAEGPVVSGELLAERLAISRVAVGKHVGALRELGYRIQAVPGVGYRLLSSPEACLPEEVAPLLAAPLWVGCDGGPVVGSTNEEAKRLARAGAPEGTVVVASTQERGRGRLGREWASPTGGAYVSFVLRPPLAPAEASALSLVVALGAGRALEALGVPIALKWPNDLQAGGRKLGGILLEMAAESDCVDWVVAGCGINVVRPAFEGAAWVREWVPNASPGAIAAAVLDGIAEAYGIVRESGFAAVLPEYERRLSLVGASVAVRDAAGHIVATGTVHGVAADGGLLMDDGTIVHAGEVTLRA